FLVISTGKRLSHICFWSFPREKGSHTFVSGHFHGKKALALLFLVISNLPKAETLVKVPISKNG
ncbi:MAG: hypothetical protein II811_06455, partial [Spirochaetaceae bacterium]|nr:hypothetical protein [Spirochaetaceae bacterium]